MEHLSRQTAAPFRGSEAVRTSRVTKARLRGPDFVALYRDVYVGAAAVVDTRVRVQALALRAGPRSVVGGPLAALAWGVDCPWDEAEVVLPTGRRRPPAGVTVRVDRLSPQEVAHRMGAPVTSPVRTAFDLARRPGLVDAVAAVDALAHAWEFDSGQLTAAAHEHLGVRGSGQARRVIGLMDPRAESLMESRTRMLLVLRGLPRPVSQHPVILPTWRRRVRLDLAWPEQQVAVEYDGEDHRSISRHGRDLDRDAALEDLGWDVVRVTARQVLGAPDALAARILRKLAARSERARPRSHQNG